MHRPEFFSSKTIQAAARTRFGIFRFKML